MTPNTRYNSHQYQGALEEAEFYNITDLIKLLKERLARVELPACCLTDGRYFRISTRDNLCGKSNGKFVYR